MKTQSIIVSAMLVLLFSFVTISLGNSASFQSLGDLPGGEFYSKAYGVSSDGSIVVGKSSSSLGMEAFRWESGVMTGLGDLVGGDFNSVAYDVSADGSVVVGKASSDLGWTGWEAFRWEDGTMVALGSRPSRAFEISADGSVIVGYGYRSPTQALRWENGTITSLADITGDYVDSFAYGVSPDGSVVVGSSGKDWLPVTEAFIWENDTLTYLGSLGGWEFSSYAHQISADGLVVVGSSFSPDGMQAFRWQSCVMIGLGDLPGGGFYSTALGVSGDGSLVVGSSLSTSGEEAFIWDINNGMMNLRDVLQADYGVDLTGWTLSSATGISDEGLTIVGYGINPEADTEAWIVKLPKPGIETEIDIKPETLNLKSKGKWISCDIWLPEGYDVADVNSYSVFLEDEIGAEWIWLDEEEQVVMTKFSREDLCQMLAALGELGDVELTVSGELIDGTRFEGTDIIRVIDKGKKK